MSMTNDSALNKNVRNHASQANIYAKSKSFALLCIRGSRFSQIKIRHLGAFGISKTNLL